MRKRLQALIDAGVRFDANETAFLERELTFVEAQTYDVLYSVLKAREIIPIDLSLPPWAQHWSWTEWDEVGSARELATYADDLPRVDVSRRENIENLVVIGAAYGYNIDEMRAAAQLQQPIDRMRGVVARNAIERMMDDIMFQGDAKKNFKGFANNANVPDVQSLNGAWTNIGTTTPDEVLADMFAAEELVNSQSGQNLEPDTMALPTAQYASIASRRVSSQSDTTILAYFLQKAQFVKQVVKWNKLNTADSGDPMGVVYLKRPDILKCKVAIEFEQQEPEKRNLEYVINCTAKMGGTVWHRPLGGAYLKGI